MTAEAGISWSAPVLIRRDGDGALSVTIPAKAAADLGAAEGDVLNWTKLPDGTVEVWVVKKGGYAGLDALDAGRE